MAKPTQPRPPRADDPAPGPGASERHRRRWPISVFLVFTMVASITVAAGSAYGIFLYDRAEGATPPIPAPTDPAHRDDADAVVREDTGPCAKGVCNYMILGSDSRKGLSPGEQSQFGSEITQPGRRSDTIMVVHVDPAEEHATVLSFPRDLWVKIPHQGYGRITSAYEAGEYRVANVIHRLTGLQINGFLTVNLAGFEGVVRALGSVPICIASPLVDPTGFSGLDLRHAGCYELDPQQALAFVRARHICDEGGFPDFNRIARQQQFLRVVLARTMSAGAVFHAKAIIDEVLPNIRRSPSLDVADMYYLVDKLRGLTTGAVDFRAVPTQPTTAGAAQVLELRPEARQLFERLRTGKPLGDLGKEQLLTPPSPAAVRVRVLDQGSGGAARKVSEYLLHSGFDIQPLGTAPASLVQAGPGIYYAPGADHAADVVRKFLPPLHLQPAPSGTVGEVDVAVVIDSAYNGPGVVTPTPEPSPTGEGASTPTCP
ncbi:MAG TPA: LCP family protein [Actinomycetota bacterium]